MFHQLEGAGSAAWNAIKGAVKATIHAALKGIEDVIDWLTDIVHKIAHDIYSLIVFWTPLWTSMWTWIWNSIHTVGEWIANALAVWWRDVGQPIVNAIEQSLVYWVGHLSSLIDDANRALDALVSNVVDPVVRWIESAAATVGGWINSAVSAFYRDVLLPIADGLAKVGALVNTLWTWFSTGAEVALEVVGKAMAWLVWFAEHSFEDLIALWTGAATGADKDWLLSTAQSDESWAEGVLHDWERLLA